MSRQLLALCYEFAPGTTPTAIRSGKILRHLARMGWQINVVTAEVAAVSAGGVTVHCVPPPVAPPAARLSRFLPEAWTAGHAFPDDQIGWAAPAVQKARELIKTHRPDALVVFMMPYSAGLAGLTLKQETGLPLLLNLDDSPTCTDMHPFFASRALYERTRALEDRYAREADALVYVSQHNLDRVRARQPQPVQGKFYLVRYGADAADFPAQEKTAPDLGGAFRIVYIGGMNGWYEFYHSPQEQRALPRRLRQAWRQRGRHELVALDGRGSSPVFVGRAARQVKQSNPAGNVQVTVYGNRYPPEVIQRVLTNEHLTDTVTVSGPVPNADALRLAQDADLLFLTLPDRPDNSPGGRISAKTYEYLMTDRPILAALPPGENWDYLHGKPGVYLVRPADTGAMAGIITELTAAKRAGQSLSVDRSALRDTLGYAARAREFERVLDSILVPEGAVQSASVTTL